MADTDREMKRRPDPDALLALAGEDGRGKLTIFLGAAPGVGKTYAMLARAQQMRAEGAEVIVGLVETHGRKETEALLDGLEVLPRRKVDYKGYILSEFDLDAALARRPKTIIVDELAHSNPDACRHPKRYQDIEELIAAGIDVWTAMNIQHLESLSDVVAQITGVTVRERVPDGLFYKADEVILVDLPPADLIKRLHEGKVYLPDNAKRAVDSFFRLGNLTALRELALRRTAERVDDQMVDYLKQNAIEGSWAASERLLVCVGPDKLSEKVVRTASRLASSLNAPWTVICIERADRETGDSAAVRQIDTTFRLAEQLGAETRRVIGTDFVAEILKLARREHATQIVIGAHHQPAWKRLFRRSLADALTEEAAGIAVHLITADTAEETRTDRRVIRPLSVRATLQPLGIACAAVVTATLIGRGITALVELPNLGLLFLMAVLVAAALEGYLSAFAAAFLSLFAYNYFFIDPLHTLSIAKPHAIFALVVFLAAALVAGSLASRIREQAKAAYGRAGTLQALYDFSRKLSGTAKVDDVLWASVSQLQASLKRNATLLLPEKGELKLSAAWPPDTELDVTDMTAARWAMDKQEMAGHGTTTLPSSTFQFRPLTSPHGVVGVCGIGMAAGDLDPNGERVLSAILDQTAIAIDRARLSRESLLQAARLEGERLRTTLLSSITHDLKAPVATIASAIKGLRDPGDGMTAEGREGLLQSIETESGRLSRFATNLADMTRIETGTLNARRDRIDVGDISRTAIERARKQFPGHIFETSIAPNMPTMIGDAALFGQVLFNLLDNASRYGGDEPISLYARKEGDEIVISVTDLGKGIKPADLDLVFEKFYRRGHVDGRPSGAGLGLPISKGFVEAMGGRITAESPAVKRKGTRITMRFPVAGEAAGAARE